MFKQILLSLTLFSAISLNCMEIDKKDAQSNQLTINGRFSLLPKEIILEIVKFALLTSANETELKQIIGRLPQSNKYFNALMKEDSLSMKIVWLQGLNGLNQIKSKFYDLQGLKFNYKDLDKLNENALVPQLKSSLKSTLIDFAKNKEQNLAEFHKWQDDKNEMLFKAAKARKGCLDLVVLALSNGAKVNAKDIVVGNWTALISAAIHGHKEMVKILMGNDADIHAKDDWGGTALMGAAEKGYKEIVELFISNGAKINAKDNWGRTALLLATKYGHKEVVEILEKAQKNQANKDSSVL